MSTAAISPVEIHEPAVLDQARQLIESLTPAGMQQAIVDAVDRNARSRGTECINLLAPGALVSPTVQRLLSCEVGQRVAEGHIGSVNRWFAGTKHIDEIE